MGCFPPTPRRPLRAEKGASAPPGVLGSELLPQRPQQTTVPPRPVLARRRAHPCGRGTLVGGRPRAPERSHFCSWGSAPLREWGRSRGPAHLRRRISGRKGKSARRAGGQVPSRGMWGYQGLWATLLGLSPYPSGTGSPGVWSPSRARPWCPHEVGGTLPAVTRAQGPPGGPRSQDHVQLPPQASPAPGTTTLGAWVPTQEFRGEQTSRV